MSFRTTHRNGAMDNNPPIESLVELLSELDVDDDEHPDVSVTSESGWVLSAFQSGLLTWENEEDETIKPRHMKNVSRVKVLELWTKLADGKIEEINNEFREEGYQ